jgi:hypothetical protein
MRKEYGGIFKAKYYWEYQEKSDNPYVYSDKGSQTLRSNKGNAWRYEWITYMPVPEKIVSQFKKDVDAHFADIEKQKQRYICVKSFKFSCMGLFNDIPEGTILYNSAYELLNDEQRTYFKLIQKPTGDHKMKLEIHNQQKPKEKTVVLELRNHLFRDDVKTVAPINDVGIVFFEESGKIKVDKDAAARHGFEVEII